MKNIRELLRDTDPLGYEPAQSASQRDFRRKAILGAVSGERTPVSGEARSRLAVLGTIGLTAIAISFLGLRVWPPFISDLQAAVRFEIRLAEDRPLPGLRKVNVPGSDRSVYLDDESVVTNADIAAARVVPSGGPSRYSVSVEFNASGTEKMRAATRNHIGKPMAILIDGQVVMAPVLRASIAASAMITGNFTRTQAERIVKGIAIQ